MDIGKKLKSLRRKKQLTLEDVANRCELSKGFLSQVENNNSSPSISTLEDILDALGSSLKEFFADDKADNVVFSAADYFENVQEDYTISYLVPNAQKNAAEPIKITIHPDGRSDEITQHDGEDFGYMAEGCADLVYGDERYHIAEGDSFYLYCDENYHIENNSSADCTLIWVSTPPFF